MPMESTLNLYQSYSAGFGEPDCLLLTTSTGERFTYGDAERESARCARLLTELGMKPGDRLSVLVHKSPQNLWLFLGALRAGLIYHPLNTAYTDDELRYFLDDAAPALLVCDPAREAALRPLCEAARVDHLLTLGADGSGSLASALAGQAAVFDTAPTQGDDVAALVYSSGTTGRPKGIMLTHANLVSNASTLVDLWGFGSGDCLLHALPIYHVHGLFVAIGCVLMSGASLRWIAQFDIDEVLQALPHSTVMMGVPTYYTRLLADDRFDQPACAGMRLFISGSAPLLGETFHGFERRTGHRILERYGMTETGMNASNPLLGERRPGTVGRALPGVELRVCGPGDEILDSGAVGDLQVRGPNVFKGYWNMPAKTAEDFSADGFFRTGDQATIDGDGYVSIVGRSRDMVISGGLNVYPREVEQVIDSLAGVEESAVIGLPDADFGESVAAVVVRAPGGDLTEEEVRDAARARLAGFKVPKRVFFASALPRNAMGKVRKDVLRARYSA